MPDQLKVLMKNDELLGREGGREGGRGGGRDEGREGGKEGKREVGLC